VPARIPFVARRRTVLSAVIAASCGPLAARGQQTPAPAATPEMVNLAAEVLYSRELERARAKRALDTDRSKLRAVRRAALQLIDAAPQIAPDAARWSWVVDVETREEPIAYCLPGGKIMVSTALVDRLHLTPGELAVVIAHAIAHALTGQDAAEAIARVGTMPDSPDPNRRILQLVDILSKLVFATPHDMATERSVDTLSLEYVARAGLDPEPAVEAWRKVARAGGTAPPSFLALHPVWRGRIEEIQAQIPAILPLYEQAKAEQASRPRPPAVRMR
jgi:predicted Zn-dependent protease